MKLTDSPHCARHLQNGFYNRVENLDRAIATLEKVKFQTIVCTGLSGVIFASPLSIMMNKQLIVIRKESDTKHASFNGIEKNCHADKIGKYVIVDDLIDSGRTIKRIKEIMAGCFENATHVGTYLYDHEGEFIPTERI
jgi:adenine/guanine phosphoribosyltransferase-like PRPP-binding protein